MHDVLTLVLGGGRGARLYPLTKNRSEPAVPVAGKYRLIDIPISNCLNSGVKRVYVLTQFLSVSLHRHIAHTYQIDAFSRGFVEVLAAQQTNESADWYQGTADAIRQNLRYIEADSGRDALVLSGDQLYRIDFRKLVAAHRAGDADVTVAVAPVTAAQTADVGVVCADDAGRIIRMVEKPQGPGPLAELRTPAEWLARRGGRADGDAYLANMGMYVFRRQVLVDCLRRQPAATDLVLELLYGCLKTHRVEAYLHAGYWQDLGTIRSYLEANLALAGDRPPFDFHSPEGVIYTHMRFLPASRVDAAQVQQCLISDGCVVEAGARLERCVVGVRSRIGRGVVLRDTVSNGADLYETEQERAANRARGVPDLGVGDNTVIERAILDKDCRVGRDVQIVNRNRVTTADGENYVIRDGIVVIPKRAVVPDGTVI
jgi:glucose-1-phosphate adenylyltransferase